MKSNGARVQGQIENSLRAQIKDLKNEIRSLAKAGPKLDPAQLLTMFSQEAERLLQAHQPGGLTERQITASLRQAVLESMHARKLHLSHLVELDRLFRKGVPANRLRALSDDLMAQAGVRRIQDAENIEYFSVLDREENGDQVQVVEPAYVDMVTGHLIRPGQVKIVDFPWQSSASGGDV